MTSVEARMKTNHYLSAILAALALAVILPMQWARPAEAALDAVDPETKPQRDGAA